MQWTKELPGSILWLCLIALRWIRLQITDVVEYFTDSILSLWEEGLKSIVRETFNAGTRIANSCSTWCLAILGKDVGKGQKEDKTKAWQSWWQENRQSSLNAFIASHSPSKRPSPREKISQAKPSENSTRKNGWRSKLHFSAVRWKRAMLGLDKDTNKTEYGRKLSRPSSRRRFMRTGSDLFDRPSGYAVESPKRGILEDVRMSIEVGVTAFIDFLRRLLRRIFFIPDRRRRYLQRHSFHRASSAPLLSDEDWEVHIARGHRSLKKGRSKSLERVSSKKQTTAGDAIRAAGYPLQIHTVTTPDGYIMQMERIPRPGVRDVVFFMHGILDTSMGWVANGTGSHAFAAFDQGMDVWLGSSRSNPPRKHRDADKQGPKYWNYSVNEMGTEDCLAQIDHIHVTKCQELHVNAGPPPVKDTRQESFSIDQSPVTARALRRSSSDSAIEALAEALNGSDPILHPISPASLLDTQTSVLNTQESFQSANSSLIEEDDSTHSKNDKSKRYARRSTSVLETKNDIASKLAQNDGMVNPLLSIEESGDEDPRYSEEDEEDLIGADVTETSSPIIYRSPSKKIGIPSNGLRNEAAYSEAVLASSPTPSLPSRWSHSLKPNLEPRLENGQAAALLSPDRSSHDGVEEEGSPKTRDTKNDFWMARRRTKDKSKDPYRLRVVGHSLGGAALLIYLVTSRLKKRNHHIYRLILLTPAGFLQRVPVGAYLFIWGLPIVMWLNNLFRPGKGAAVLIPSTWLRYITFKLTADLQSIPALQELTQAGIRLLLNGDTSQWDRAMQMPHYNPTSMPAMSLHTGIHIVQWVRTAKFGLFDYGSVSANRHYYGQKEPIDIAANYSLIDCPVDIMAGKADGVIAAENVRKHYDCMRKAGCDVTYKEFNFGHLDFTFALKEELIYFVQSRLRLRT